MSNTFPPRPPRRLPLMWAGLVVVAASAGGLWVWLGQLVPQPSSVVLASLQTDHPPQAPGPAQPVPTSSPIVVRAEPVPPPPVPAVPPSAQPQVPVETPAPQEAASAPPPAPVPVPVLAPTPEPTALPLAADKPGAVRPSFDIVRVTPRGEAVLAGRAAPGATVTITDNGRKIAEAVGDKEGQWVALPDTSLPEGGQQLALSSAASGQAAVAGEAPLLVIVPPAPAPGSAPSSAAPAAALADAPRQEAAVAILTPLNAAPRVLQGLPDAPSARPARPDHAASSRLGLDIVDYDEHGAIRFGGTAPPGTSVRAYVDNKAAGDATADADGHWSVDPAESISPGAHRLRIDQVGSAGKVAARVELPFERTSMAAAELREGRIVVQPKATLWRIARRFYGQGVRYTVIYQANRDQIVDPDRIFPGQIFAIPPASVTKAAN